MFRESSSPPRASVFLIYVGVRRRPKARRCPRPIWGGPTWPGTGAAWGHLFWPSDTPSCPSFCPTCFFSRKSDVVFSPILFYAKIARGETLLKTASESAVLFKYGRISEQIMRQSAWKSGCILDASAPPSLAHCLSSNNSNIVQKR